MSDHARYHFSVTVHTDDLPVVGCLRALADFSQRIGNKRISWGGTKDDDWRRDGNRVTFRFSTNQYREGFLSEVQRLLPTELWRAATIRDDDPATPQAR
ncbi:MAG: hypothetical protein WA417_20545 [Stellaceae bacterium]|jgi:hypothetical protein